MTHIGREEERPRPNMCTVLQQHLNHTANGGEGDFMEVVEAAGPTPRPATAAATLGPRAASAASSSAAGGRSRRTTSTSPTPQNRLQPVPTYSYLQVIKMPPLSLLIRISMTRVYPESVNREYWA